MAGEDHDYLELVRKMRCCAPGCSLTACEAHHPRVGVVGVGQRGHDKTAIPLCPKHHSELHSLSGVFKAWDGRSLREWQQDRIVDTQEKVATVRALEPAVIDEEGIPF